MFMPILLFYHCNIAVLYQRGSLLIQSIVNPMELIGIVVSCTIKAIDNMFTMVSNLQS